MLGGVTVLVGLAAWLAFGWLPRKPYLLERATRIATLKQDYPFHRWLTSHEVVLISPSQNGMVVDTATGRQQPVNTGAEAMGMRMANAPQQADWNEDLKLFRSLQDGPIQRTRLSPEKRRQVQAILSHLPHERCLEGFAASPDHKRQAYLLEVWRLTPLETILERLLPLRKPYIQYSFALYLSDPNGEHMQEAASEPIPASLLKLQLIMPGQFAPWPHNLQFTPDGKHVSFLYKGALWTVPVKM